jgi:capsular exopolysaccharide synthesis family protein
LALEVQVLRICVKRKEGRIVMSGNNNLQNYFKILRNKWKVVAAIGGGVFSLVLLVTMLSTPIYDGTAKVIIERVETDNLTGSNRVQPQDPEFYSTQFQLIRSHAVARRVVDLLGLEGGIAIREMTNGPSRFSSVLQSIRGIFPRSSPSGEKGGGAPADPNAWTASDKVARQILQNVRVRPIQGSRITEVTYSSPNPAFAALIANTFVQAYLEKSLDMKMDATQHSLTWLTPKADAELKKLQASEKRLQTYMEENNLVTMEDRMTIVPEALTQLGRELISAESRTKEHKLLYDKVRAVAGDLNAAENVLAVSEGGALDVLRAQILQAEQLNMELSSKYGAKHPMMLKAVADLNILINRIIQKLRNQYELARDNENSIRGQLNQTKSMALGLNEKYVGYSVLKREIDTNRQLYDALLTKIKEQSVSGERQPVNISIVENAKVPQNPVRPMVMLNLLLGLILGLCCGIAGAFVIDHQDLRIKAAEDVADILKIPALGSITFNRVAGNMKEIVRTAPRSEFTENYNALRTTLLLSAADTPPRHILISSSIAGEGKTTTSTNLALTMAKAGSRVLLIDADLRKPTLHKVFKLHNQVGLSSYLAGSNDKAILNKGSHENLFIIPAGPIPPNPYELLSSNRMETLLDNLAKEFDVIICDSPPILSVADARVLCRFFDGMIVVARAGLTTYPMVKKSIRMVKEVKGEILGILVNAVQTRDLEYYGYYSNYLEVTAKPEVAVLSTALQTARSEEK